jgi:hypothetical protein
MAFFELRTPRDMFAKAEREFQRLQREFTIDNLFNFFVTACHIQDYVRKAASVPQFALEAFLADPDLKDCRDLCDKGKHLRLTQREDPTTVIWRVLEALRLAHFRSAAVASGYYSPEIVKLTLDGLPHA